MVEKTIIKTLELPFGQEWLWYPDANVVVLSPCLDEQGRQRALSEVQAYWRRSCLHVVAEDEPNPTVPFGIRELAPPMSAEAR